MRALGATMRGTVNNESQPDSANAGGTLRFAEEARKMHFGETEERQIRGSSTLDEARELAEEGVPFGILPALPEDLN